MDAPNSQSLPLFSERAKQLLSIASILERRYKKQSRATDEIAGLGTNGTDSDDEGMVVISPTVLEHENEVKTRLLELIQLHEEYVNDSRNNCANNFSNARHEFSLLFEIWTNIRKVCDIVKYASTWDEASLSEGQTSLQEVSRQINETLLQHFFEAHLLLFSEAIRKLSNDTNQYSAAHQQMQQQQLEQEFQAFFELVVDIDPEAQQIFGYLDYLLDFFRDSVDRVKHGTLSVWRREQKKAMLGIGLTVDMVQNLSATKPAIALRNATMEFQELAKVWMQIDLLTHSFCSGRFAPSASIMQKSQNCAHHLLQSSFVVDWRYQELCQPHIVVRASTMENVAIIAKILAVGDGFCTSVGQFPSLINPQKSSITATFVKPVKNAVAFSEETASHLRDDTIEDRKAYIDRAGNITQMHKSTSGVLQQNGLEVDSNDKTAIAQFDDVAFVLSGTKKSDARRKKGSKQRDACTKYHIDVTAEVSLNSAMVQMTSPIQLRTLSTPFSYSVVADQDKKIYRAFVWNLLGSHPDSVSCHCQPLPGKDEADLSLVYWGDYKEALKWLFYKLTHSRTLYDEELQHLGNRLLKTNDLPASKTFGSQRGDPSSPSFSRIHINKKDKKKKFASFFYWYFQAIELVMDKGETVAGSNEKKSAKEEKLTMGMLFQSGMILGFISRNGAEDLLRASDRNAMVIRFSDHYSGHVTVSYINKQTDDQPEKLEHVRPLAKHFLKGMSLPLVVAMLINLENVHYIIASRLLAGQTSLTQESLKSKNDLVKNHLEGIMFSEDQDTYARVMLHASRKESSIDLFSKYRQWIDHPEVIQLVNELEIEAKNSASSATFIPALASRSSSFSEKNPLSSSPYASFMPPQMTPSPNSSKSHNQIQSPISAASSETSSQQSPFLASQMSLMSVHSPNQIPPLFQPTNQKTMGFQPTTGMQMMQPQLQQPMTMQTAQEQPMAMQTGLQTQWQMRPQMYQSNVNFVQNNHQQQQIRMGLQQMTIDSQQQQRSITSKRENGAFSATNQNHQQQMLMQHSVMSQIGQQQAASQYQIQNHNTQPQMMQQQPSFSSFVQQPQQGMMQSSLTYQPQQQYYPQLLTQQPTFLPQQSNSNLPALQPQQTFNFQNYNQALMTNNQGEQHRTTFKEEDSVNSLFEEAYKTSAAKIDRKN